MAGYANPDALIETDQLEELLEDPGIRVIEVDVKRQRIALTMRLDDAAGSALQRRPQGDRSPATSGKQDRPQRAQAQRPARDSGREVREIPLTRHDVYIADEMFLTGTAAEMVPVVSSVAAAVMRALCGAVGRLNQARPAPRPTRSANALQPAANTATLRILNSGPVCLPRPTWSEIG